MSLLPIGDAGIPDHSHIYTSALNGHESYTLSTTILHKHGTQEMDAGCLQVRSRKVAGLHRYVVVCMCVCD